MTASDTPGDEPERIAARDRDERGDGALRGDDRRDDRDLADAQRRVRQLQADDVADPGQTEQPERRRLERSRARD